MARTQETYIFDGTALLPIPEQDVYGQDPDLVGGLEELGFAKLDAFFPEELCSVWQKDPDDYLIEILLDGSQIRTIKVDGFPRLMDFIRSYLHPLVVVQSHGFRTAPKPQRAS